MPDEPKPTFTPPKELKMFPNDRQLCLARFSPCGHFLAAGAMEGTVRRWSVVEKPKAAAEEVLPDEPKKKPAPKNAKKVEESPVDLVPLPHLAGKGLHGARLVVITRDLGEDAIRASWQEFITKTGSE